MAQTTISRTVNLTVVSVFIDVNAKVMQFVVGFEDATSGRRLATRAYTADATAGTLTDADGGAMPTPQAALKAALFSSPAASSKGVIGELNAYITANAGSFAP